MPGVGISPYPYFYNRSFGITPPAPPFVIAATDTQIVTTITGLTYEQGDGPSQDSILFRIWADGLTAGPGNITVTPSTNLEFWDGSSWSGSAVLIPYIGDGIFTAIIYKVRLKAGLSVNEYNETLTLSGPGATDFVIDVTGDVEVNLVTNLVGAWNLDGNMVDSVNGNNGFGNPSFVPGLIGQCIDLNLTGHQVSVASDVNYQFGSGEFAISIVVQRNVTPSNTEFFIGKWGPLGVAIQGSFAINFDANKINAYFCDGLTYTIATSTSSYADTNWHWVLMQRSGNNLRLYVDNVLQGTADLTGLTMNDTAFDLVFGRLGEFDAGVTFNGKIDMPMIYKGRHLLAAERTALWNGGAMQQYPF